MPGCPAIRPAGSSAAACIGFRIFRTLTAAAYRIRPRKVTRLRSAGCPRQMVRIKSQNAPDAFHTTERAFMHLYPKNAPTGLLEPLRTSPFFISSGAAF